MNVKIVTFVIKLIMKNYGSVWILISMIYFYYKINHLIGYDQKYTVTEFDTKLVTYVGPICDKENNLNYTMYIRYSCGNHLVRIPFIYF